MKLKKSLFLILSIFLVLTLTACQEKPKTRMETVCVDGTCFEMEMEITPEDENTETNNTEQTEQGSTETSTTEPVKEESKELDPEKFKKEEAVAIKAMQAIIKNDLETLYPLVYIEGDGKFVKQEDLEIYFMINDLGNYIDSKYILTNAIVEGSGYEKKVKLTLIGGPEPIEQEMTVKLLNKEWRIVLPDFVINDFIINADITANVFIDNVPLTPKSESSNSKTFEIDEISGIKHNIKCSNKTESVLPGKDTYNCTNQR